MNSINDLNRHVNPIASEIEKAISRVLASGWFVLGPEVKAFEKEFADYCGTVHCVTLANGTDALELALRSLNIGPSSVVMTVANAGMYSSAAILATGATPVYADIEADSMLMNYVDAAQLIDNKKIDAIVITHLYGMLADVEQLRLLAKRKNIPIIEDCAQAHGAVRNGKKAGSFGDISCFSFYPTKNLGALGDGGAIISNRDDLAQRVRQLRQYGWESKYRTTVAGGRNSRLDEMQAAVLRVMLPHLDQWNIRRRDIANQYTEMIRHANVETPSKRGKEYVSHLYVIKTNNRGGLKQHLTDTGVPSDIHYPIPDYLQPAYAHLFHGLMAPVTERQCELVLTLPCFPEMTDSEVKSVIAAVNSWLP
jgi:dTDP-4-amino-4,6-dideoxygalactose transaminase